MNFSDGEGIQERKHGAMCQIEPYQCVAQVIPVHSHHVFQHHKLRTAFRLAGQGGGGGVRGEEIRKGRGRRLGGGGGGGGD